MSSILYMLCGLHSLLYISFMPMFLGDTKQDNMQPDPNWPFPPANGPVPWSNKQIKEYDRKQREQAPEAPF